MSNQKRLDCLHSHLFRRTSKKSSNRRITDLCEGNSSVIGDFPEKEPVTRKCFHLMTSSRICTFAKIRVSVRSPADKIVCRHGYAITCITPYWPLDCLSIPLKLIRMYDDSHTCGTWRHICDTFLIFLQKVSGAPKSRYGIRYQRVFFDVASFHMLTHWDRDKMAAITQTMFSNAFSWMKMNEFRLRFHWSLLLKFEWTIFHHWFR